jgi:hypothetical protein
MARDRKHGDMALHRYDCEVYLKRPDAPMLHWGAVVAAPRLSRAVALIETHVGKLYEACEVDSLYVERVSEGDALASVVTPTEGVYTISDFREVRTV